MLFSDEVVKGLFALAGGLIGTILGAVIKGYFDTQSRERRELIISLTKPTSLIVMSKQIAPRVELRVDGRSVKTLASSEVRIVNVGNRSINDVHICIELEGETSLLSAQPVSFSQSIEGLKIELEGEKADIFIPYINPVEEVDIQLFATSRKFIPKATFRQPDVKCRIQIVDERAVLNPIAIVLIEALSHSPILDLSMKLFSASYRYARSQQLKQSVTFESSYIQHDFDEAV